ncbi:MAG: hypothetical protein SGJ05_06680 [bacterium]|nr:hypothetical protein [bacterium]
MKPELTRKPVLTGKPELTRKPVFIVRSAFLLAFVLGTSLIFLACGTPRPTTVAPCISAVQHDLTVRWGTEHDSAGTVEGYELNAKGELFRYGGERGAKGEQADITMNRHFLVAIDQAQYCDVTKTVQNTFLKVQALNVRGIRGRFIEYVNAARNVYLRAVWNPDLSTFQSRDMREQYDALMQLVPR